MKTIKAYWFQPENGKLGYDDNRTVKEGLTHKVEGDLALCSHGLHASIRPFDALQYTRSSVLWLVELSGNIIYGEDKVCASERKYIQKRDISETLREFSRNQALIGIHKIKPYCTEEDYKTVINYLKTGDPCLRSAARSAARSARSAAWSAARSAAESAAESAESAAESAESAAWSAESAAWSAAWSAESAAWSALSAAESAAESAESAAWSAAESAWSAAWSALSAARSAARSAAESAADESFTLMIQKEFSIQ